MFGSNIIARYGMISRQLYKLYVRPHQEYRNVIYHIPAKICEASQNITVPKLMEKLESAQYSAVLAITGTLRGTSRNKLYLELGWESLNSRRWSRRLTLFYKIINIIIIMIIGIF